jgi:hypothetical protein
MNYYTLCLLDQPKTSWVLHDIVKQLPKKEQVLPPVFYKFFPPPSAEVYMKPRYQELCCKKCGRYDTDLAFALGFEEPVTIRFKEDMDHTDDRIFVINDKCLNVLQAAKVGGYETKPIGKSGWHALRVTLLVDSDKTWLIITKPNCTECGRPKGSGGSIWNTRQISVPAQANTFFSTNLVSPSAAFHDRQIFLTEDVYQSLKAEKINALTASACRLLKKSRSGRIWRSRASIGSRKE